MLSTLAAADTVTWLAIFVKAGAYFASLLAAGSVLVLLGLRTLPASAHRRVVWTAVGAAVFAAVLSLLRIPLQASFLTGGAPEGARDPMLLRMVFDSPLGDAVTLRLVGLGMICATLLPGRGAQWIAGGGAVLVAASFAMRGHALEEPRLLLGSLITVHVLGLAFWIGALAPLARVAWRGPPAAAGALAQEFGAKALWVVGILMAAGGVMLALFGAASPAALKTAYGQGFALKLVLVFGVLSLAAFNKLRLTTALLSGEPGAGAYLRQSIRWETALIAIILLTTAAATTVSAPPGKHASLRATEGLDTASQHLATVRREFA